MNKAHTWLFSVAVVCYLFVFSVVSFRLYERIGAFGCGDECINYTAGYFLTTGKSLYSQIFFNHQPVLAYASAWILGAMHPSDIYHLVLYHRWFVVFYSLCMGIVLIWRFRLRAVLFLLAYESTKYYWYGYQFIGEAFIVYPLVYMCGLTWESFANRNITKTDAFLTATFGSLVFWIREPYVPLAMCMCVTIFWLHRRIPYIKQAGLVLLFFIMVPLFMLPRDAYVNQVIVANIPAVRSTGGTVSHWSQLMTAVFYPALVYVTGVWSYLRLLELWIGMFFWIGLSIWLYEYKKSMQVLMYIGFLALAGLRVVIPGTMYFEAFHMLPWYVLFIWLTVLFITSLHQVKIRNVLIGLFIVFVLWAGFSPKSFMWEQVNRQSEFESQYAKYSQYAQAIRIVSHAKQTLFLDEWDDIIYWESQRTSSYPLSLYIPVTGVIPQYRTMRAGMFEKAPPDMYYRCPGARTTATALPTGIRAQYVQLQSMGSPGCLYVKSSLVREMTQHQWQKLGTLGITQP